MAELIRMGSGGICERELFVIDARSIDDVPTQSLPNFPKFACLIAWDATKTEDADAITLARRLILAGCVYVCCWGPDCERVHDLFDQVDLEIKPNGPITMSTWHHDESLAEALWNLLFNTYPKDEYLDDCRGSVAITIGSASWATEARAALADTGEFNRQMPP